MHRFHLYLITMHPAHGNSHVHLCSATYMSNSTDLLSHCVTQENHLELFSTLYKGRPTQRSSSVSNRNHTPILGALSQVCILEDV
jgi:hypothetical protein